MGQKMKKGLALLLVCALLFALMPVHALAAVDTTTLQASVDEANALVEADYTAASWAELVDALDAAETVLADTAATQTEVDDADTALQAAITALVTIAALEALVAEAGALVEAEYTPASWAELEAALEVAEEVLDDPEATQDDVDAAAEALQTAMDDLVTIEDGLQTLVDEANALVEANYTPDSWTAFADALDAAEAALAATPVVLADLQAAYEALQEAMDDLVAVDPVYEFELDVTGTYIFPTLPAGYAADELQPLDVTIENTGNIETGVLTVALSGSGAEDFTLNTWALILEALVAEASELVEADYTPASWTVFADALEVAEEVLAADDPVASPAELQEAIDALQTAMDDLAPATPLDTLNVLIAEASALVEADYTPASWTALQTALTAAEAVAANTASTPAQITNATTALQTAMNGLVDAPVAPIDVLIALVAAAEELVEADYTPATWTPFATALAVAETVVAATAPTAPQITNATVALRATMDALVKTPLAILNALIAEAEELVEADYTTASWTALQTALTAAEAVAAATAPTAAQITTATTNLQTAIDGLAPAPVVPVVGLPLAALAAGEEAFFTVVPNADLPMGTHVATVTVSGAPVTLGTGTTATTITAEPQTFNVRFTVNADKEALQEALDAARELVQADYTPETWFQLAVAMAIAQFVLANDGATQDQINAAYAALQTAMDQLLLALPFTDVPDDHWALLNGSIDFVWREGIMIGVSATEFAPEMTLTRAQIVRALWNMEGQPETAFRPIFSDVLNIPGAAWYNIAVIWAYESEIVQGRPNGTFAPHENVTREEIATILHRYAEWKELDVSVPTGFGITNFPDHGQVSPWALTAMRWAVYNELVRGTNLNTLAPLGNATRAECATLLHRFILEFGE